MKAIPFECSLDIAKAYEEQGRWIIEGLAATSDFDLQDDIIMPEAIEQSAKDLLENSTVLHNHNPDEAIGKVEDSRPTPEGLWLKIFISQTVPDIWQKIKEGVLNKFSVRGQILEAKKQWVAELLRYARLIYKMRLLEVSLVAVPANPKARALAWYVEKALDEYERKAKLEDAVLADQDQIITEDLTKGGCPMPEDKGQVIVEEELLEASGEAVTKSKDSQVKPFPQEKELTVQWGDYCAKNNLLEKSGQEVWPNWQEFCKQEGYALDAPYPYPAIRLLAISRRINEAVNELLDGEEDADTITLLQEIQRLAMEAVYPYPMMPVKNADQPAPVTVVEKSGVKPEPDPALIKQLSGLSETVNKITAALGLADPKDKNERQVSLKDSIADLSKRLEAIEGLPALKTSLDGQEDLADAKKPGLWKGLV